MNSKQARNLTLANQKYNEMSYIFNKIEESCKMGNDRCYFLIGDISDNQIKKLRELGYGVTYDKQQPYSSGYFVTW